MPVNKRQFELAVNEQVEVLMVRVYEYLKGDPNLAYSRAEIAEALGLPTVSNPLGVRYEAAVESQSNLTSALATLMRLGGVVRRSIRRVEHYRVNHELNTETWERVESEAAGS